nr:f-box protein cpr30 [Quercus suber]
MVRVLFSNYGRSPKVEMYTVRTGKWRNIDTAWTWYKLFPLSKSVYVIGEEGFSVVVYRAFHWMVKTKTGKGKENSRNIIIVFDMGAEEFAEFTLPKNLEGEEQLINMSLAVVDGLLALVPCNLYAQEECYSVWVMREYGVAESWTKLLDIDVVEGEGNIDIDIDVHEEEEEEEEEGLGRVVGFTKDEDLLSYEPSSRRILNPHIRGQPESFYMNTYVESLVLLNKADGTDSSE